MGQTFSDELEKELEALEKPKVTKIEISFLQKELASLLNMNTKNHFNIAFVGASGVGKSSLINAVRGLRNQVKNNLYAKVDQVECTQQPAKYVYPGHEHIVLWDIPGGETARHKAETYFYDQSLDAFDFLIIVVGVTMSEFDTKIAKHAQQDGVPFALVKSKLDQAINNKIKRSHKTCDDLKAELSKDFKNRFLTDLEKSRLTADIFVVSEVGFDVNDENFMTYRNDELKLMKMALTISDHRRHNRSQNEKSTLLQAGADVNSKDIDGSTLLHAAAHWCERQACELLVENMCNIEEKNLLIKEKRPSAEQSDSVTSNQTILPYNKCKNSVTPTSTGNKMRITKVDEVKDAEVLHTSSSEASDNNEDQDNKDEEETSKLAMAEKKLSNSATLSDVKAETSVTEANGISVLKDVVPPLSKPNINVAPQPSSIDISTPAEPAMSTVMSIALCPLASISVNVQQSPSVSRSSLTSLTVKPDVSANITALQKQFGPLMIIPSSVETQAFPSWRLTDRRISASGVTSPLQSPTVLSAIQSSLTTTALSASTVTSTSIVALTPEIVRWRKRSDVTEVASAVNAEDKNFTPPQRSNESEVERKAQAKCKRETRRLTQGITLEAVKAAEQLYTDRNKKTPDDAPKANDTTNPVASTTQTSATMIEITSPTTFNNSSYSKLIAAKTNDEIPSKVQLKVWERASTTKSATVEPVKETAAVAPNNVSSVKNLKKYSPYPWRTTRVQIVGDSNVQQSQPVRPVQFDEQQQEILKIAENDTKMVENESSDKSAFQGDVLNRQHTHPNHQSTGSIAHDDIQLAIENDDVEAADENNRTSSIAEETKSIVSLTNALNSVGSRFSSSDDSTKTSSTERSKPTNNLITTGPLVDFSNLYEKEKSEGDRMRNVIINLEKLVETMKLSSKASEEGSHIIGYDRRLERRLSELEEENKILEQIKADNQRLMEENAALIRFISKLSKSK